MKSTDFRSWLLSQTSLTDQLTRQAGEAILKVLSHDDGIGQHSFWQREIMVSAKGEACWYARTVAPEKSYTDCIDFFEQLKTKKLGDLIYNSDAVKRESIVHFPISQFSAQYQWLPESIKPMPAQVLWMRASHFILREVYSFDLFEIYLPALLRYC